MLAGIVSYTCALIVAVATLVYGGSLAWAWLQYGIDNTHKFVCVVSLAFGLFVALSILWR